MGCVANASPTGAEDIRERAEELRAVAYLSKPVDIDLFAAVLKEHCVK